MRYVSFLDQQSREMVWYCVYNSNDFAVIWQVSNLWQIFFYGSWKMPTCNRYVVGSFVIKTWSKMTFVPSRNHDELNTFPEVNVHKTRTPRIKTA